MIREKLMANMAPESDTVELQTLFQPQATEGTAE
jgi:hypothetical protein